MAVVAASCSSGSEDGAGPPTSEVPTPASPTAQPPAASAVTTDPPASESTTPDSTVPDSTVPDSTVPDPTVPGSTGPAILPAGYEGYTSDVYADDAAWMCRDGIVDDVCVRDLDATAVFADGTTESHPHEIAPEPAADCFYVYPTVSQDPEANSDFEAAEGEEINTVLNQAARLTGACRVYAPIYRQRTLTALSGAVESDDSTRTLAYDDVADAFIHFIANDNDGRPFVLIGHSQGAGILDELVRQEIDGEPLLRDRMLSAILLGTSVTADGYETIPPCATTTDVNCVVSYSSYRNTAQPMPGAFFGSVDEQPALCVNPVDPAGGGHVSEPYFRVDGAGLLGGGVMPFDPGTDTGIETVDGTAIDTPFVVYPDMVTVECVDDGTFGYLQLTTTTAEGPRTDDIGGDLTPEWGMHLVDANVAMGDLVRLVQTESDAFAG